MTPVLSVLCAMELWCMFAVDGVQSIQIPVADMNHCHLQKELELINVEHDQLKHGLKGLSKVSWLLACSDLAVAKVSHVCVLIKESQK